MIDLQNARINTAGAYVLIDGYYLFALGIRPYSDHIPVVRLGGHREEYETGWQCAVREVYEEASLHIKPLELQMTYAADWDHTEEELREIPWQNTIEEEPGPILVVTYHRESSMHLSLMYLTQAEGLPNPCSEVKGLVLLTEEEIYRLCRESVTLEQYLSRGGKAILNADFDADRVLEPFVQLRLLSKLLRLKAKNKAPATS